MKISRDETVINDQIKIVNIITSTKILGNFDIESLCHTLKNVQYEPEQFPGLIYRKNNYTIILFYGGNISSHGCKSEKEGKDAIINTIKEIDLNKGIIGSSRYRKIIIVNMLGVGKIDLEFDLQELNNKIYNSIYDPSKFPALVYHPYDNKIAGLIFNSKKIVIVGARSQEQIKKTYYKIIKKIKNSV